MAAKQELDHPVLKRPCGWCNEAQSGEANHEMCPIIIHGAIHGEDAYCPCGIKDPDKHPKAKGL